MKFDYSEIVTFMHCIEVNTDDEEMFEDVAEEIADEMNAGCDDGTGLALFKFKEAFGEENVTFIKDDSGDAEYEC